MRRAILLVVLLGLGSYLIGGKTYDSNSTVAAVQPSATPGAVTAAEEWPAPDQVRADLQLLPSNVIAAYEVIGADRWQLAGFTGHDVRIAVVDTGFDGYAAQLGASLPEDVHARSFRGDGRLESGSQHGTLAARIIHSIAPRAELYLANFGTVEEFEQLVAYLQAERVQVVSFSLGFVHNGPGDGTGEVNSIISQAVDAGMLWMVAAGNWAQQHWSGAFTDGDGNFIHEFQPGVEDNGRAYRAGDLITVSLRWDEPWGFACTDYDLELFGPDGALVQAARSDQSCSGDPVESLQVLATNTGRYRARIVLSGSSGLTPGLDLLMLGAPDRSQPLDYFVTSSSLAEPADNPGVVTIGAENPFDTAFVANFSSQGPTKDGRAKPDLVAPTGLATGGEITFSGTSAATPHAAGAAALLFEAYRGSSAADIARQLAERATPASVVDGRGAGKLQLGTLEDVGPVLPPGDGLASITGLPPGGEGEGVATLLYRGANEFPARFYHLIADGRVPTAIYRARGDGQGFDVFVVDGPRFASTFEVFNDGDILLATFP